MVHGGLSAGAVVVTMMRLDLHSVFNFDGQERRSGDDRRCAIDQRSNYDRRGDDRIHCLPRRICGDRREGKGIRGRRATD